MLAKLRSRLTYANVMATIAVFIALGGSSYAALKVTSRNVPKDALTGADIKNLTGRDVINNSLTGADVKNLTSADVTDSSLLPQDFAPGQLPKGEKGEKGEPGNTGPPGSPGAPGVPGSPAASTLTGRVDCPAGPGCQGYLPPVGKSAGAVNPEEAATTLSPNHPIVARDLKVKVVASGFEQAGEDDQEAEFELRDDYGETLVRCEINVPLDEEIGTRTCDSGSATALISPGSELSLEITVLWGVRVMFGWRATTP